MLLHVWLYDFYDMGYFTEQLDGHVINMYLSHVMKKICSRYIRAANKVGNPHDFKKTWPSQIALATVKFS